MSRWTTRWGAAAALVTVLAVLPACQREPEQRTPTPLDLSTVGTISGEVRLQGPVPPQTVLDVGRDECAKQHAGPVLAGDVLVHDGKVQNALVYLKSGLGERVFAVPATPVTIDQQGCLFVPRVAAAQVGQPVQFLNSDPLQHNVHAVAERASGWNFSLSRKGAARTVTVDEPDPTIELKCDIHPWMRARLAVFDHPYFAVTGADGRFTFANVPPGSYVVEAWHERFGTQSADVALGAKEAKALTFTFAGAR